MGRRDIITIAVTFVVGFFFGIYLFFSGFFTTESASDVQTQNDANSFSLIGEVYGGCQSACPSFQVLSDGSYRYQFTPVAQEEQIIRDGVLPRSLMRDINETFVRSELERQGNEIQPSVCSSFTDGIDVEYRITINSENYTLDTCGTEVDTESELWATLVKIWNYFETGRT